MKKGDKARKAILTTRCVDEDGTAFDMVVDLKSGESRFCGYGKDKCVSLSTVKAKNGSYKPYPAIHPYVAHGIVRFPSAVSTCPSKQSLLNAIDAYLRQYLSLSDSQYLITARYILVTWLYPRFNVLPYLRVRGDYGTGKSRFLHIVGSVCYQAMFASGASTVAPLFHLLHRIGGTLILDEADFRYSSETAQIVKILNNGNTKGFPVLRCQKTKHGSFDTVAYRVFGPKLLATRHAFEDVALESRCITFDMQGIRTGHSIPTELPQSIESEMDVLRNALLAFRLGGEHGISRVPLKDSQLSSRSTQVYSPILSLVESNDDREVILAFAREHQAQMTRDRGMSVVADVLRVLHAYYEQTSTPPSIGLIAVQYAKRFCNDVPVSAKWMGSVVRRDLHLITQKSNGRYVIARSQDDTLQSLYKRYDVV